MHNCFPSQIQSEHRWGACIGSGSRPAYAGLTSGGPQRPYTLFFQNDESVQMNSNTERVLLNVSLNSSGRIQIERAVRKDLEFMKPFATVTVSVSIVSTDRVVIGVNIVRLDNLERRAFVYIWDATNSELIERETKISSGGTVSAKIFGPEFDYTFE